MRKLIHVIVALGVLWAGTGIASAQTAALPPPAWTPEHGIAIRNYAESQKDPPFVDPNLKLGIGMELPNNVTLYPVPETLKIPSAELYTYGIVNGRPVVVDRSTRKVVHIWE